MSDWKLWRASAANITDGAPTEPPMTMRISPDFKEFVACANKIDETTLPFIALEDLKKNKRATGRHQDPADLENLE